MALIFQTYTNTDRIGETLYVVLKDETTGLSYKPGTGTFAAAASGTRDDHDLGATVVDAAGDLNIDISGATLTTLVAAMVDGRSYSWRYYSRAGGTAAVADAEVAQGGGNWNSTAQAFGTDTRTTSMATGVVTAAAIATDAIGSDELADNATAAIAAAVWSETLPGSYVAGTAGYLLGSIEASTSSDGSTTTVTTGSYATNLQTMRDNYAAKLAAISANPKPTYSIDGQSVSWDSYRKSLLEEIDKINGMLSAAAPFEYETTGTTG
jgi:hypothetical protein